MEQIIGEDGIIDFLQNASVCLHSLNKQGIVLWANQAELDFLGYKEEDYIGHSIAEFFIDQGEVREFLRRLGSDESLFDFPAKLRSQAGDCKHALISTSNYCVDGQFRHTRCVTRDISDYVRQEKKFKQAKKEADLANQAKSQFLANMSHELKTPLSSIMGFTLQLQRNLTNEDNRTQDSLGTIYKNAKHLLDLINDILDLSKAEADKLLLKPEVICVAELAKLVFDQMAPLAEANELDFILKLPENPELSLIGDRRRITQVMINLVSNAIKYTLEGSVTIEVLAITDQELGDSVLIKVVDTGIGIKPESFKYLFRSYSQLSEHGLSHIEGTGLGLAITDELVRMHRGRIGIDSFYGQGSCFSVLFPQFYSVDEFAKKVMSA